MALTDNSPTYGLVPGNRARADDPPAPPSLPLQRLARLHDEARQTFQATRLLERAPQRR